MCDIRLFQSAQKDYTAAEMIWQSCQNDEMILNIAAYHLQQSVEKILKGALECVGVTVPYTHKISRLLLMITDNGANLTITDWLDDHAEMLSEWETETRYNMDFLVEKRKLDRAIPEIKNFMDINSKNIGRNGKESDFSRCFLITASPDFLYTTGNTYPSARSADRGCRAR